MRGLTVVGAPTSAGAYSPGQEDGPGALRAQGLIERLAAGGAPVRDAGDVERFRWRPDPERPRAANAAVVGDRARQVARRVAQVPATDRVLVLGGDCTVGVGTVAGLVARGGAPGLVYFDRHGDINVPSSTIDGALDWMGVAHMLDADGAADELAGIADARPMLDAGRICYLGLGPATPFEREQIARRGIAVLDLAATIDDPAAAARARSRRSVIATRSPCTSTSTCSTSSTRRWPRTPTASAACRWRAPGGRWRRCWRTSA